MLIVNEVPNPEAASDLVARSNVINLYRLAFGRDPESEAIITAAAARPFIELVVEVFGSLEFHLNVNQPFLQSRRPRGGLFDSAPDVSLRTWAREALDLTTEGRERVAVASSWITLYAALVRDPVFGELIGGQLQPSRAEVLRRIEDLAATPESRELQGGIDSVGGNEVRGWAVDLDDPSRSFRVELLVNGVFSAAAPRDRFRRDVQQRFGGDGVCGFVLQTPIIQARRERLMHLTVVEAISGAIITEMTLAATDGGASAFDLAAQLAQIREALAEMEAQLPHLTESSSTPLELWSEYAAFHYPEVNRAPLAERRHVQAEVLILAAGLEDADLLGCLEAVAMQDVAGFLIVLLGVSDTVSPLIEDGLRRASWRSNGPVLIKGGTLRSRIVEDGPERVVVVRGGAHLAPDAVRLLLDALDADARVPAAYADDDQLSEAGACDPRLRSVFDLESVRLQPEFGEVVAVRRAVARTGVREEDGRLALEGFLLRSAGSADLLPPAHVNRCLSRRISSVHADPSLWAGIVERDLRECGDSARLEFGPDPLGAPRPTYRLRRRECLDGLKAFVVIPTRDNAEVLEACLKSLESTRATNRCEFEICVVDNGSTDPSAVAVLARAREAGARITSYPGTFNWPLLNNLAVARADAHVAVFLNDDTVAVTPDWCDGLVEQAMRPSVGAVGARLMYPDGTLQHGGMVVRRVSTFGAHEGVGVPGMDGGYLDRLALTREVMAVTGACLATRLDVFRQLGGFDSGAFPVVGNDVDYCLRARSADLRTIYAAEVVLYHIESASRADGHTPDQILHSESAMAELRRRWGKRYGDDPYYNAHFERHAPPFRSLGVAPTGMLQK